MKYVEDSRRLVGQLVTMSLTRFRSWLSSKGENLEAIDALHDKQLQLIASKIVEDVLEHCGHRTALRTDSEGRGSESKARRTVAKILGG